MRKTTLIVLAVTLSIISSGCNSEPSTPELIDHVATNSEPSTDAIARTKQGLAHYKQGEFEKAIADYTKAIELDPAYAVAYNNRGIVYHDQGELDKAIADVTKLIELDPAYARAYNNEEKAKADFTKAKELGYEPE
jgi:tetratricopeptide (TPR) repeat protein